MESRFRLLAVAPPGLEKVVEEEVSTHLSTATTIVPGGVEFNGGLSTIIRANLCLHTPTRVLVRVGHFWARDFKRFSQKVSRYPWEIYISRDVPLKVRVTCKKSRLWHSGAVEERLVAGIKQRLGFVPTRMGHGGHSHSGPYQLVVCRVISDRCTIQVDTSGDFLFRRGYKAPKGVAPLRENLAASLCVASGWDMGAPMLDPFCGTGTIAIEAALMAARIPPGRDRHFPFMKWRIFDRDLYRKELGDLMMRIRPASKVPAIFASDIDGAMVEIAQENARRAGVAHLIRFEKTAFQMREPPVQGAGWVIANLPYGKRLRRTRGHTFLKGVIDHIDRHFTHWHIYLLMPPRIEARLNARLQPIVSFDHGGIEVALHRVVTSPSRR